jgi:TonB family protein
MPVFAGADGALTFLIACTVKVTVILSVAFVVVAAARRNSSAMRHHLWAATIAAALMLPICVAFLPAWHSTALGSAAAALSTARGNASNAEALAIPTLVVQAVAGAPEFSELALAVLFVWILGFAYFGLRLLVGLSRLSWLTARSRPLFEDDWMHDALNISRAFEISRAVRLLECRNALAMPLTHGFFRPAIILPAGAAQWNEARRGIVLSHELAHIARSDWLVQICAELVRAVYWFHPLVWLAAARLRQESERACDDAVLLSGIAPSRYASQLLDLARTLKNSGRVWSTALAIARPTNLERRFAAMLNPSVNRRRLSLKAKFLIPFLAALVLVPLAALRLPAQQRAGKTSGTIHDPSGATIANATIVMSNHDVNTIDMTTTDREGNFSFTGLPAGKYELQVFKPGFQVYRQAEVSLDAGSDWNSVFTLQVGALSEHLFVVPEDSGRPVVTKKTGGKPSRLTVGGNVQAAKIISKVPPVYPEKAKSAGVTGTVVLHAVIGIDGRPLSLRVMNAQVDPDLARSAVEAVSQWRYTPTLLNGEPIEVDTTIDIVYSLQP